MQLALDEFAADRLGYTLACLERFVDAGGEEDVKTDINTYAE